MLMKNNTKGCQIGIGEGTYLEQEHSNFLVGSTKSQWPGGASDGSEGGDNILSCQVISAIFIGDGGSCLIHELAEDCCRKQGDSTGGMGPTR